MPQSEVYSPAASLFLILEQSLYVSVDGKFTCLDGSVAIPFSSVNDDYCDCKDGSDEPGSFEVTLGTSACYNSLFYCDNKGFNPALIPASLVNDGICDPECCDGSDETGMTCPNVCEAEKAKATEKLNQERAKAIRALEIRNEFIEFGQKEASERRGEIEKLRVSVNQLESTTLKLKQDMETAQENEKRLREVNEKLKKDDKVCPLKLEKYVDAFNDIRQKYDNIVSKYNRAVDVLSQFEEFYDPERKIKFKDTTEEGAHQIFAKVFTSFDQNFHEALVREETAPYYDFYVAEPVVQIPPCDDPNASLTDCIYSGFESAKKVANSVWKSRIWTKTIQSAKKLVGKYKQPVSDSEAASSSYYDSDYQLREQRKKLQDLELKETLNFGPQNLFSKLFKECFEFKGAGHDYDLCFMDKTSQGSSGGYKGVNLGNFKRWGSRKSADPGNYSEMLYDDGDMCAGSKPRSTLVKMECGEENKLLSVLEPDVCEYEMVLSTPLLCEQVPPVKEFIREEL